MGDRLERLYKRIRTRRVTKYYVKKTYYRYMRNCRIDQKTILLESQHGTSLGANIAALLLEFETNELFRDHKLFLAATEAKEAIMQGQIRKMGCKRAITVSTSSPKYFKLLATAGFLVNDNTFTKEFIKREGQVYLNTWHGTPLKTLGKYIAGEAGLIGNTQKNFLMADYLICPNEFTRDVFVKDYMLENIGRTKLWLTGYPRNCAFNDDVRRAEIRKECKLDGIQAFVYMPTWRGVTAEVKSKEQNEILNGYLKQMDDMLTDDRKIFVKLHPISASSINVYKYKHIFPFPARYSPYEFLNACDGLITDYSSVFFDFAVSRQKIVLFTYDKEDYLRDRGLYFPLDELPFPQADNVKDLVDLLNRDKTYDDTAFLEKYCKYDNRGVQKAVAEKFVFGTDSELIIEQDIPDNKKPNVVLYAGDLEYDRSTDSFLDYVKTLDTNEKNYFLLYSMDKLKYRQELIKALPQDITYLGFYESQPITRFDAIRYDLCVETGMTKGLLIKGPLRRLADAERMRVLCGCRVDEAIDCSPKINEINILLKKYRYLRLNFENSREKYGDLVKRRT